MKTVVEADWLHTKKPVISNGKKDTRIFTRDLTATVGTWSITIREGFEFDGASIPKPAWSIVGHPFEEYEVAAGFHDILYDSEWFQRQIADDIFLAIMTYCKVGRIRRNLVYRTVRMFGGPTWIKHTPESIAKAKEYLQVHYAKRSDVF